MNDGQNNSLNTGSAGNAAHGSAAHQRGFQLKRDYFPRKAGLVPGAPCVPGAWYSRGYLPHRDELNITQSLTFRLADSLPGEKLRMLEEELKNTPVEKQDMRRRMEIEKWLDAGMGCCALRHPALAGVVEQGFLLNDGVRYHLLAWCVMPNHAHVLARPLVALATITGSWKSYSGRWAMAHNAELNLRIPGKGLWQRESWDRYMRSERHLSATIAYIHNNPVKAGLCEKPEDWRWSSAWKGRERRAPARLDEKTNLEAVLNLEAALVRGAPGAPDTP